MAHGKHATTVCDGCGIETEETCWWRHVTEQISTNSGICHDILVRPQDYCRDCWRIMNKAIYDARAIERKANYEKRHPARTIENAE